MTTTHTSRRALLKGAAMLTVLPVVGIPSSALAADLLPAATPLPLSGGPDLSTFEGRLVALSNWFDLTPAPLTYDEEDPRGGVFVTPELIAWMKDTDVSFRWLFNGDQTGASAEEQRRELAQQRRFLQIFRRFDETEQRYMVEALERGAGGGAPLMEALDECRARVEAYRAAKARALL